jgi:DNA-binding CsgD family transcriptional regulator
MEVGQPPSQEPPLPIIDPDVLVPIVNRFVDRAGLTPSERSEVLRLAQGFACKDSAAAADISPETIRARRKRIYRKLGLAGSGQLIAALLAMSLQMLATGERLMPRPSVEGAPVGPHDLEAARSV